MSYIQELSAKFDILKRVANNLEYEFEMDSNREEYIINFYPFGSTKALGIEYRFSRSEDLTVKLAMVFTEFIMTKDDQ